MDDIEDNQNWEIDEKYKMELSISNDKDLFARKKKFLN